MKSALEQAIVSLSRRALTRFELEKRLRDKGYSEQQILEALQRICEWGYIDDRKLALDYCQTRQQRYSRRRISEDLRLRGVDEEIIEEVIRAYPVEEEFKQCLMLAEHLWEQEKRKLDREALRPKGRKAMPPRSLQLHQKVGRKLLYRGYPYELIHDVLQQIEGKEE